MALIAGDLRRPKGPKVIRLGLQQFHLHGQHLPDRASVALSSSTPCTGSPLKLSASSRDWRRSLPIAFAHATARAGRSSYAQLATTEVAPARHAFKPQNDLTLAAPPSIAGQVIMIGPATAKPGLGKTWFEPSIARIVLATGPSTATLGFSKFIGVMFAVLLGHFD